MKKQTDTALLEKAKKYAEKVLKSTELSKHYHLDSPQELYDKAYLDYLTIPKILGIFPGNLGGRKNKPIMILAHEICKIQQVEVKLENYDGIIVEVGLAQQHYQKQKWYYSPKNALFENIAFVEATAYDRAGNKCTKKIDIDQPVAELQN